MPFQAEFVHTYAVCCFLAIFHNVFTAHPECENAIVDNPFLFENLIQSHLVLVVVVLVEVEPLH